ncbi:MAG: hypothetical protein FJ318_10540 [SAR202 cluster bacterium]|nr:hypothetical protein [SAR202 cluster bacterium]
MRFSYLHGTTKQAARDAIERAIPEFARRANLQPQDFSQHWEGDTLRGAFHARGINVSGTVTVTDTALDIELRLPMALRPFEGEARRRLTGGLDDIFGPGRPHA